MSDSDLPIGQISSDGDAGWISQIQLGKKLDWFKVEGLLPLGER